jgi:hypothetical protein
MALFCFLRYYYSKRLKHIFGKEFCRVLLRYGLSFVVFIFSVANLAQMLVPIDIPSFLIHIHIHFLVLFVDK